MKIRFGVLGLLLPLILSACTAGKSGGPDKGPGPTPTPIPSPLPTKVPPIGEVDACKPEGFEEARSLVEPTLRAAFCLDHAKEKSCPVTEDYLVACMTLAGDLDPALTREHIGRIMTTYEFKD